MMPELHLFILWDKVGPSKHAILQRIAAEFDILRVFRIRWSPSLFSSNLSRFYGQSLPAGCNKEESCGTGPFTLVVVRDKQPIYQVRETTRGDARVNIHTFDLKTFFRSAAGGNLPVHATDTSREASHDLTMVLGVGPVAFENAYPGFWDGEVISMYRDVVGARGWESLDALFAVFNETLDYIVLRNFDCLPYRYSTDLHGDIDLLVGSYADACLISNAAPVFHNSYGVHRTVLIGGEAVPFDFRYLGDKYYDEPWQRRMLESRILAKGNFFIPDAENHFYSLLYHAAIHKPAIAADYVGSLSQLAESLNTQLDPYIFSDPRQIRKLLGDYMGRHGYRFTRPSDPTVCFNAAIAHGSVERMFLRIFPQKEPAVPPLPAISGHAPVRNVADEPLTEAARANLLRPFRFDSGQRILELGCEGGVITRYLGESGADVVAIESVPTLAAISRERCSDLPNVQVICDDPIRAEIEGGFDIVTLIGTPEYIAVCEDTDDPLGVFLGRAASLLKAGGALILALDNQLGLKYFNGCKESCTGLPYFGVNNLYRSDEPATVGRRVLTEKLEKAGFKFHEFLFPFPDFKFPGLILSEAALYDDRLNVADLLVHNFGRDYPETRDRAFAEDLAWHAIAENRLLADLANSFLVLAKLAGPAALPIDWLAKIYSRGRRYSHYQIESTIASAQTGGLIVHKRRLFPGETTDNGWLRHVVADAGYLSGNLVIVKIHKAMARQAGLEELAACFRPWLMFLRTHAVIDEKAPGVLPGNFVDCIPANLIENSMGELQYFDAEWVSETPVPLGWVMIRGITYSLIDCLDNLAVSELTYRQFISQIAERNGILLPDEEFAIADLWEARLVAQCHLDAADKPRFVDFLDHPLNLRGRLGNVMECRNSVAWHQAELARVKTTISWRVTIPLRVTWNLFLKLVGNIRKKNA